MSDPTSLIRHFLLKDEDLVKNAMQTVHLADGEILFHRGDVGDAFYLIKSGQIRVFTLGPTGEEITLNTLSAGETLGELALIDARPRSATAITLSPCTLLRMSREDFLQQVRNSSDWTQSMIDLLSERVRHMTEYVEQLEHWTRMIIAGRYNQVIQTIGQADMQGDRTSAAIADLIGNLAKVVQEREDNLRKQVFDQLEKGREIQRNFLPNHLLQIPDWEIAALFQPARQVAGDFYDVFKISEQAVGLVIADVCDKGVGAALFMALFRSLIRIFATQAQQRGRTFAVLMDKRPIGGWIGEFTTTNLAHLNALQAVSLANDYVSQNHSEMSLFATLFFGVLDPTTGLLTYINGGHEPPMIINESGGVREQLNAADLPVGIIPNVHFQIYQTYLKPGETLLCYTDGVTDARAVDRSFFTQKRLLRHLDVPMTSAQTLIESISASLRDHVGEAEQFDDTTLLAVHRKQASNW